MHILPPEFCTDIFWVFFGGVTLQQDPTAEEWGCFHPRFAIDHPTFLYLLHSAVTVGNNSNSNQLLC